MDNCVKRNKRKPNRLKGRRQKLFKSSTMAKYNVVYKSRNGSSRCTYVVDASSEYEAIQLWKKTISGSNGQNEVIEVYRTGTR